MRKHRIKPMPGKTTILVAEDDAMLRAFVTARLSELGYAMLEAENGIDALAALARAPANDLLFTDIDMPGGMNGLDLAEKAQLLRPKLKILFTSGASENIVRRLGPKARLLKKPYTSGQLAVEIRRALED